MGVNSQKRVLKNLKKQLGVAVRSVQWSYAIFWSLSTTQQGVVVWGGGYYNGDIKTRKTGPTEEVNGVRLGLRRSERLRELYELLLEGGSGLESGSNKRPSASLAPEDLSDLECVPGRTLANGRSTWVCNAQDADSTVFSRSLLAKSASVQTVLCFPHMDGVIELGVTDAVSEDSNIIQHIKTSLLKFAKPICFEISSTLHDSDYDSDYMGDKITKFRDETMVKAFANYYSSTENIKFGKEVASDLHGTKSNEFDNNEDSPNVCSTMYCGNNHHTEDSLMLDGNDDVHGHRIHDSSGCISQAFRLQEHGDLNHARFGTLDLGNEDDKDSHYKKTVAIILGTQNVLVNDRSTGTFHQRSSFVPWNREVGVQIRSDNKSSQKTLKKMLFTLPLIITWRSPAADANRQQKNDCPWKPQADNICNQSSLSKKSRENEKYVVLGSLIPSVSKTDKTSVDNTIEYLKKLEARVDELESCVNLSEQDARAPRRKNTDMAGQTSDNTDHNKAGKKLVIHKRKDSEIDRGQDPQLGRFLPLPLDLDVKVSITGEEVLIEMSCSLREYLLVDIMEVINNLTLDAHTVQSAVLDGILTLTIQSKFRGASFVKAGMIRQALRRTAGIY